MTVKAKRRVRPPQVFINFRGDELRDNFVNQLVRALREGDINVFIDLHELKGRKLKTLFTRIENSKIALAVFSKRYCESKWCLNELAKMNDEMQEGKLVVIPIFYNVTSHDVKRAGNLDREADFEGEEEEFTVLFKKMKEKHANNPNLVNRWELALKSVTERVGFSTNVYGKILVKSIVLEVRRHLGMPLEKPMSDVDVASALWASSVFSYIIAPLIFPDVKFFKTGKWVLGFPFLVLVWHIWDRENKKKALAYISQMSHITIWDDKEIHKKSSGLIGSWRRPYHSESAAIRKQSSSRSVIRKSPLAKIKDP
ncbi:unnamed protein product [Eruca vesicaria subsp. sativa]|uniref:TIR domain-containing protein n=1 Tax=Eruca vesicaria subsp. sativa TaxID=29727 RepID=A0ABC8JM12_ERUVS|nr:unnamed protein product [Eruca vesicaria subsp. sativa]